MAIGIRLKRAADDSDIGASKLFGTPTVPPDIEYYDGELGEFSRFTDDWLMEFYKSDGTWCVNGR